MKKETIDGFSIPKRELTEEEATRLVTLERFNEWHRCVGEDFIDQHTYGNGLVFAGFIMAKRPELSKEVLNVVNGGLKEGRVRIQIS